MAAGFLRTATWESGESSDMSQPSIPCLLRAKVYHGGPRSMGGWRSLKSYQGPKALPSGGSWAEMEGPPFPGGYLGLSGNQMKVLTTFSDMVQGPVSVGRIPGVPFTQETGLLWEHAAGGLLWAHGPLPVLLGLCFYPLAVHIASSPIWFCLGSI